PYVLNPQFLEIRAQVYPTPLRQRSALEVIKMPDRPDAPGEIDLHLCRAGLGHSSLCPKKSRNHCAARYSRFAVSHFHLTSGLRTPSSKQNQDQYENRGSTPVRISPVTPRIFVLTHLLPA